MEPLPRIKNDSVRGFSTSPAYDMTGTEWFLLSFQSKDEKLQRLSQYFAGLSPEKLDAAYNLYID
jgi:hypothetical protein